MVTNHKCAGSGYAEILLEADLVTSGCLKAVLSGKAYAKALFCLKTVCESMERLLMEQLLAEEGIHLDNQPAIIELVNQCNRENLDAFLNEPSSQELLRKYHLYREKVHTGHLGKTAKFWLSVIDACHLLFMLQYSVKTNCSTNATVNG